METERIPHEPSPELINRLEALGGMLTGNSDHGRYEVLTPLGDYCKYIWCTAAYLEGQCDRWEGTTYGPRFAATLGFLVRSPPSDAARGSVDRSEGSSSR